MPTCPRCFGRGYTTENRYRGRARIKDGFYVRTCRRCGGAGYLKTERGG